MKNIERYELLYIKFTWAFIAISMVNTSVLDYIVFNRNTGVFNTFIELGYFLTYIIFNLLKHNSLTIGLFEKKNNYMLFRFVEATILVFGIGFIGIGNWAYFFVVFILTITSLTRGTKWGLLLSAYWCIAGLATEIFRNLYVTGSIFYGDSIVFKEGFISIILIYIVNFIYVFFCGFIYKENMVTEEDNKRLISELGEKYTQLAVAQDEVKFQYEKLKDTNFKLEETNKKLTSSIAEFYTLQQISQAISSIFDIKELLRFVNDIILGVMGVNDSTIVLYDDRKKRLKVHTTSIKNQQALITLNDNINCDILMNTLNSNKPIIENFVDSSEFPFTHEREVNSLICVSLSTKSRKFGLVLIEHKFFNAFDEENLRLIEIISQQVGIAMENAELYQQMQELATIDGLTGVYNRLHFHERLQKEFLEANVGQYALSLAIFDIDHFKKFNDTFGHLFGDRVLKNIADNVKSSLRSTDVIARFGGEEFIIMFPRTGAKEAFEKVERLRKKIENTLVRDGSVSASVTVSFGISTYPDSADSENELLSKADDALYEAKNAGRNCVMVAQS